MVGQPGRDQAGRSEAGALERDLYEFLAEEARRKAGHRAGIQAIERHLGVYRGWFSDRKAGKANLRIRELFVLIHWLGYTPASFFTALEARQRARERSFEELEPEVAVMLRAKGLLPRGAHEEGDGEAG